MLQIPSPEQLAALAAQPAPMALNVTTPINDIQLITLAAAMIYKASAGTATPKYAVQAAREMFVEAVVAERRQTAKGLVEERLGHTEHTKAGEQFVIPGTR